MRRPATAFCLVCVLAGPALAQTGNPQSSGATAIPPAPLIAPAPPAPSLPPPPQAEAPPPGLVQTPAPPAGVDGDSAVAAPAAPPAQPSSAPPVLSNSWVPGGTAKLGVLNKVDGSVSELTIPVGGQANAGDLTLNVLACVNRPPGQIPDAAVFLNAQNETGTNLAPVYRGWMVRSAPGAAVVGDATETFRVINCS